MQTKKCSHCNIIKPVSDFRIRIEKRTKKPKPYYNNTCRVCDAEIHREYINKKKQNPKWLKERNRKQREYNKKNNVYKKCWQKLKNDPEWKNKLKAWREKNKDRVKKKQKLRSLKHHTKIRDNITDAYVINRLMSQFKGLTREEILNNPEIMQIKRNEILIHRVKIEINKNE